MKEFFKDWKIHLFSAIIALVAECIGIRKFQITAAIGFSLFPMLYAMAIGVVLGAFKLFSLESMKQASAYTTITVMFLLAQIAAGIAPGLYKLYEEGKLAGSSLALILQEFGNLGTVLLGIPVAVFLFKMNRTSIGCTISHSREGTIAIVGELYGLDSEQGIGVMGGYVTGTVLGTIFFGLMASLCARSGLFHPYALGAACGVGSTSMMSASLGALQVEFPEMAQDIRTYAYTSQALSSADGMIMTLVMALPMANWLYKKCAKLRGLKISEEVLHEAGEVLEEGTTDPHPVRTKIFMLVKGWVACGIIASVCNYIFTLRLHDPAKVVTPLEAAPGLLIFLGMIVIAQLLYELMKRVLPSLKCPAVIYIIFIGIILTCPHLLPCADYVNTSVAKIGLLPMCTPILAYSGIATGKDLKTFKEQGIAIVLSTLFALAGTFICSAIIAHVVMKATGVF